MFRGAAVAAVLALALPAAGAEPVKIAVLDLVPAQAEDAALAASLSALLTTRLGEHEGGRVIGQADIRASLGFEQQKSLLGCSDSSCLAEIGGALGAKYLVHGQFSRFGKTLVLNAAAVDVARGTVLGRSSEKVSGEEALVGAAERMGDQLALSLGLAARKGSPAAAPVAVAASPPAPAGDAAAGAGTASGRARDSFALRLRVGNALTKLPALDGELSVPLELELDVPVTERLDLFGSAGTTLGGGAGGLAVALFPLNVGVRWAFRDRTEVWVPYGIAGVGAQIPNAEELGSGSLLGGRLAGGIGFLPWDSFGLELELGGDVGGGTLDGDSGLAGTFGLDLALAFLF